MSVPLLGRGDGGRPNGAARSAVLRGSGSNESNQSELALDRLQVHKNADEPRRRNVPPQSRLHDHPVLVAAAGPLRTSRSVDFNNKVGLSLLCAGDEEIWWPHDREAIDGQLAYLHSSGRISESSRE